MDKKEKASLIKSFKNAAVIAFGGAALLTAGFGAQKAVEHFVNPPAVTQVNTVSDDCAAEISNQFNHKSWRTLSNELPRGDGHPVLVIPGFMTNDVYMLSLRDKIAEQGYRAYGWKQGMSLGASKNDAEGLLERVKKISAENGGQKVSLVGYSLGGVYARELARAHPELVRDVITLGSPFGQKDWRGTPDEALLRIHEFYQHDKKDPAKIEQAPSVPTTSVFSKSDVLVDWRTSLNPKADNAENVQVHSGHVLMPFNDEAAGVVVSRLAEKPGQWKPLWSDVCPLPGAKLAAGYSPN